MLEEGAYLFTAGDVDLRPEGEKTAQIIEKEDIIKTGSLMIATDL